MTPGVGLVENEISVGIPATFAGTLPGELARVFHRCARHRRLAPEPVDRDAFLRHVADHVLVTPEEAALVSRAVFAALRHRGPAADIAGKLPGDLQELWQPTA